MTTKYAHRTATAAIATAKSDLGKATYVNMCQAWMCARVFGTGAVGDFDGDRAADAEDGWKKAQRYGKVVLAPTNAADLAKFIKGIPAGAWLYWAGGSRDYGHTALAIGGGQMYTTGISSSPKVSQRAISYVTSAWGNGLRLVGYVLVDGNGFTVTDKPKPPAKPKPKTTLRITSYNIPDQSKLPKGSPVEDVRVARATVILKGDNPDVIVINEGVGRKAAGVPSTFMAKLYKAIGGEPEWACVVPTLALNENYILFRRAALSHVKQYPDVILTAKSGNRHITRDVLKVKATGQVVAIGATHLVSGEDNGADRTKQGAQAAAAMAEVSRARGNCPVFIAGDMNRSDDMPGMIAAGLVNARKVAKKKTNVSWGTFTTYKALVPSEDTEQVYEHVYGPKSWAYANWINRLDTDADGKFRQPRPSDHCPVVVVCTSP